MIASSLALDDINRRTGEGVAMALCIWYEQGVENCKL